MYLLCALIPLNPYHVTPHLPDIYESFTLLATLNGGGESKCKYTSVCTSLYMYTFCLLLFIYHFSFFFLPPPSLSLISLTSIIFITGKIAEEVLLSVKVAIYFLFLQLYSLYPCSFVQYLKGRFGPTGEVHIYQEHIAVSKRERERQTETEKEREERRREKSFTY